MTISYKNFRILFIAFIFIAVQLAFTFSAVRVSGLTQKDRERLYTPFYDEEVSCEVGGGSASADGKLFMIGDSIAAGAKNNLEDQLSEKGFDPVIINAQPSRTLTPGPGELNGLGVIDRSTDDINGANVIIIELGTNSVGLTDANISDAIGKIKELNPNAQIYWVNVGADNGKRTGAPIDTSSLNSIIQRNSQLGFSIIDWSNIVQQNPDYIDGGDGLGVHLSGPGKDGFAGLVSERVTSGAASRTASSSGSTCACSVQLSGKDNIEKVWNYLITTMGFNAIQAAGAMGNLKHEGGFNPKIVEYGWGFPPEMDTIPPSVGPAGQPGYGIVQWTSPGRKAGLQALADQKGLPASDLSVQLDFMKSELEGPYKSAVLDPLKNTNDLSTAVSLWQDKYEVGTRFQPRMDAAQDFLNQFGDHTASSSGGSSGGCGTSNGNWTWPHESLDATLTSCFGPRDKPTENASSNHMGIDISKGEGNKILAAAAGTVTFAANNGGAGLMIKIDHGGNTETQYMHNIRLHVKVGDSVEAGQHISDEGTTGESSGNHLHFEIIRNGEKINPLDELTIPEGIAITGSNCTSSSTGGQL